MNRIPDRLAQDAFPPSFPSAGDERFLQLLLCPAEEFPGRWRRWRAEVRFEDVDFATQGLLPSLHLRLLELGIEDDEVRGRIRGVYRIAWLRDQRLVEDVRRLGAECERIGVPVLLLKGLALLAGAHRRTGARMAGDADLLVRPEHFEPVSQVLFRAGWKAMINGRVPTPGLVRFLRDTKHAIPFRSPRGGVVDLHWRAYFPRVCWTAREALGLFLLRRPTLPPDPNDRLWSRSVEVRLSGQAFRILSPEDMLVHLVSHGTQWDWGRDSKHRWVLDAVQLVRSSGIDWSQVPGSAAAAGREESVRVALRYLSSRGFVALPGSFRAWVDEVPSDAALERSPGRPIGFTEAPTALRDPAMTWYHYWRYQASGGFFRKWIELPAFLRATWHRDSNLDLLRMAVRRVRRRLRNRRRSP